MADSPKSFFLTPEIHDYVVAHGTPPDAAQQALIEETAQLPMAQMQIAPEQGAFMTLLVRAIAPATRWRSVRSLAIRRSRSRCFPDDGHLRMTSEEWTAIARRAWDAAGVAHKIELKLAPALDTLRALPAEEHLDLAFVDADKPAYAAYYEELLPRLKPNGLILVDNTLWSGVIVDDAVTDDNTVALRAFNDMVAADDRVDVSLLTLGDGLTLIRKK
ncbi:MAG: class I SAM-dependent methyltransferase [Acidimicrobiia bacterium]